MKSVTFLLVLTLLAACTRESIAPQSPPQQTKQMTPQTHEQEVLQWRENRRARLTSDEGWLTLIGLHWLKEGENEINVAANPPFKVKIVLRDGEAQLLPDDDWAFTIGGEAVRAPASLRHDGDPQGPTIVEKESVRFHVIKRADKYALRAKDRESPARKNFAGLEYFPINAKWRVEARYEPFQPVRRVSIPNVTGMTTEEVSPGMLHFTVDGKEHALQPILEQGEKNFFIIFKDQTSGKETYPAARYIYAPPPGPDGKTVIDFNKAYNPPCAFTDFATCPLPPPQNRLPIRVDAGEKKHALAH